MRAKHEKKEKKTKKKKAGLCVCVCVCIYVFLCSFVCVPVFMCFSLRFGAQANDCYFFSFLYFSLSSILSAALLTGCLLAVAKI